MARLDADEYVLLGLGRHGHAGLGQDVLVRGHHAEHVVLALQVVHLDLRARGRQRLSRRWRTSPAHGARRRALLRGPAAVRRSTARGRRAARAARARPGRAGGPGQAARGGPGRHQSGPRRWTARGCRGARAAHTRQAALRRTLPYPMNPTLPYARLERRHGERGAQQLRLHAAQRHVHLDHCVALLPRARGERAECEVAVREQAGAKAERRQLRRQPAQVVAQQRRRILRQRRAAGRRACARAPRPSATPSNV